METSKSMAEVAPVPVVPTVQATPPTHSAEERVTTKHKDPKKVEAGRKGAAARKAKYEAQLRKAKEGLPPSHDHMVTHAQARAETAGTAAAGAPAAARTAENESTEQSGAWIAYAVLAGAAAVAVGAALYAHPAAVSTNARKNHPQGGGKNCTCIRQT